MPSNLAALRRYRVIHNVLRRGSKHKSSRIVKICEEVGINAKLRTIQKDLQDLRDDPTILGQCLPIVYDTATKMWYYSEIPKNIFPSLELEDDEANALLFYAKTVNQYKDYPIFKEISKAIKKVINNSNISPQIRELFETDILLETEKHVPLKGIELIADILDALHKRKVLIVEYQKFDGYEIKKHKIKPLIVKEDKQMWYIIGVNVKYNSIITLALDRVKSLRISDIGFDPVEFNSEEYFKFSFGVTVEEEEPIDVVISFDTYQGNYLRTLPIHSTQKILKDTPDEFIIQITLKPSYEFYSKIKSYGSQAIVLSPKHVAQQIQSSFEEAVRAYKTTI